MPPARLGAILAGQNLCRMEKAEFVANVLSHIQFVQESEERKARTLIDGRRERMDAERFRQWLEQEHSKVLDTPALQSYDLVQKKWMATPEAAAAEIASTIEFENSAKRRFFPGKTPSVDWQKIWPAALKLPFVVPCINALNRRFFPGKTPPVNWQEMWPAALKLPFVATYIKALKTMKKAAIMQQYLDAMQPAQDTPPTEEEQVLTFDRLFIDESAMKIALGSLQDISFDAAKKPQLRAFFQAAQTCNLLQKRAKEYAALPLIAEYFGTSCHGNAAYQAKIDERLRDKLIRKMHLGKS